MSVTSVSVSPTPAQPIEQPKILYTLSFLQNYKMHYKNFELKGNLKEAIERGKEHCRIMNLRFIAVRPFMSSLQEDERFHTKDQDAS